MIRHRPAGRGHPYLVEPDQRVPIQPIVGETLELRASTDERVGRVHVEFGDGSVREAELRGPATPEEVTDYGRPAPRADAHSHLAAAASGKRGRKRLSWAVRLDVVPDEHLRYRFVAGGNAQREKTRWFDAPPARWHETGGQVHLTDNPAALIEDSVAWLTSDERPVRARFALRVTADDHIVGFGERFDSVDQRGRRLDAVVFEQYKGQGGRSYLPMPYALVIGSDRSWGFHVATSRRVWFDVGATDTDRIGVEIDLDPGSPPDVRVHVFAGTPYEILRQFVESTGVPKPPPVWIFDPWISSNEWNTQARVLAEVEKSAEHGIPAGVIVIEAWSDESTFVAFRDAQYHPHQDGAPHQLTDFTFPPDGAWPDPKAMVDELHDRGMKVLLWQVPLLKTNPQPQGQARLDRDVMVERGFAVKTADGRAYRNRGWWFPGALLPDWTNDRARRWWMEKRRYLLEGIGIDGFKTDGGEHAWGSDLRYADGTDGGTSNNLFPVRYVSAFHDFYEELGKEAITFSRAGFTGTGAYPCHWAGDEDSTWEAFRASITAGITAGASGVFFWGWDIAGFSGEIPSAELYLRAAAMACFSPIMQYHSEYNHHRTPSNDRTPWNIAERTEDARVIPIFRKLARLRQRLVPYLEKQAHVSVEQRMPLMRGLFFDWPNDPQIWQVPYQYLLGEHLLVAPVTEQGVEQWAVYVPAGEWVDAWTKEPLRGPTMLTQSTPLDVIPVLIKAAAADELGSMFLSSETHVRRK
jgi:alpha-glucosidase (family GH31 glycosyl hydrolase)